MAEPVNPLAQAQGIAGVLKQQGVFAPTPLTREAILKQREMVSGLPGLGPVDYSAENKEATDFAKLQFALSLMGRGFSAMGATPQPGEGALGTLGRTLVAPVASDISAIAGPLMKQRQAQRAAERANEARLSQAALTMQQQVGTRQDAARDQRLALARSLADREYVPTKGLQRTKPGGKTEDFVGFFYKDKLTGLPVYATYGADGKEERVPGEQLSEYRKPATALKATGASVESRVIQFPVRGKDGNITGWKDVNVNQVRQIIPQIGGGGPRIQYGAEVTPIGTTIPMTVLGPDNKPRNVVEGVDFLGTDKANYDKPVVDKLYLRDDLAPNQLAEARLALGKNVDPGEGLQKWTFRHQVNPQLSEYWYDVKGRSVELTPELASRWLTTEKPPADKVPTKPWGLDDPDFKANFAGYLAGLGGLQDRLSIGADKVGVKFVPGNYDPEKGLDPADPKFPFVRVDGGAFTPAEKKKFADRLTAGYFNVFDQIRAGESRVDLNKAFTERFFYQTAQQLGLTKASAGTLPNPAAVRTEAGATAFYKRAPSLFAQQNNAGIVLDGMPWPVGDRNFGSGVAKLKVFAATGVPFGPGTTAPPPVADVMEGADQVRALDRGNIQQRILAERIAKGTSLAGKLSQSATPWRDDQIKVVGKALADRNTAMKKTQADPASLQAAQVFTAALDAVARLDRMDASAKISGAQGFIKGPAVGLGLQFTGKNFLSWFQTAQEDEATRDFVAGLPVLRELFARELVKAAEGKGARISNQDLKGAQKTLATLNENKDYSAAKMQELRRYLVNSIKFSASQLGNFTVPDATLEQAAELGIDLKAVTGQNGYYSPYLNNGKYAVSKDQVPEFSKKYQDSLRTQGLFEYVSDRGRIPRYRLINVAKDSNNVFQPVKKRDGSFSTFTASKADLNNPKLKDAVDFNRNWLRKTYNLP
mgnify:FL=1